jgi:hypothetical protein
MKTFMHRLLLVGIVLLITAFLNSCTSGYMEVMDTENGQYMNIRRPNHHTKVGDTLLVAPLTGVNKGSYTFFGKYLGVVPILEGRRCRKVIRLK